MTIPAASVYKNAFGKMRLEPMLLSDFQDCLSWKRGDDALAEN